MQIVWPITDDHRTHWKKKLSHYDLKVDSLVELKFDPGFRVIGEYLSQKDSILRVNFEIASQF